MLSVTWSFDFENWIGWRNGRIVRRTGQVGEEGGHSEAIFKWLL